MHLETGRLLLRPMQLADVEPLVELWTHSEATRHMGGPREATRLRELLSQEAAGPTNKFDLWPVEEKATGRVIGHCGLLDKEVDGQIEYELVYLFHPSSWGQGYATEMALALREYAFETLTLTRLIALIDPDNAASERVAQKAGLVFEKETLRPGGKMMRVYAVQAEKPG